MCNIYGKAEKGGMERPVDENEPKTPQRSRNMLYFLLGILLVLLGYVVYRADDLARQFLFYPYRYSGVFSTETYYEVDFKNSRGETLYGYYFPYEVIPADRTKPGSLLYCHGNAETAQSLLELGDKLRADFRCNVLVFDYAGYGKSEGEPTAPGILQDGRAARDWLAEKEGIGKDEIIVYGFSLGGCVAVDIAAGDGARALIVESSFTSLGDMGRRMFPFLPVNWLLRERLASVEKIGEFHGPVFISHGRRDDTVPFSQGQRLFDAANEPKTFYETPADFDYHSAPHCTVHREKLRKFIENLPEK